MRGKAGDLDRLFHIVKWCCRLDLVRSKVQTYEEFISPKNFMPVDVSAFYIGRSATSKLSGLLLRRRLLFWRNVALKFCERKILTKRR